MLTLRALVLALAVSAIAAPSVVDARPGLSQSKNGLFSKNKHSSSDSQFPSSGGDGTFGSLMNEVESAAAAGGNELSSILQKIESWRAASSEGSSDGAPPSGFVRRIIQKVESLFGGLSFQDITNKFLHHKTGGGGTLSSSPNLADHNTPDDCWMQIDGQIYDATAYAPTHPAGSSKVTHYCGRDATSAYHSTLSHPRTPSSLTPVTPRPAPGPAPGPGPFPFPPSSAPAPQPSPQSDPAPGHDSSSFDSAALAAYPYCAIAVNGQVYALGQWASSHPAGASLVTRQCGKDATAVFLQSHGNPSGDIAQLQQFIVGQYVGEATSNSAEEEDAASDDWEARVQEASVDSLEEEDADAASEDEEEQPDDEEQLEELEDLASALHELNQERIQLEKLRRRVKKLKGLRH